MRVASFGPSDWLPGGLERAELYGSGVVTNIGLLHEKGHPEPWIIALDAHPNPYTTLDYGLRWGIEPMFSDFKSRGFGIAQSHIERPGRLERLILIMATAMYWAVSCGAADAQKAAKSNGKKDPKTPEIPLLPLQARAALPAPMYRRLRKHTKTLGRLDKLRGGKVLNRAYQRDTDWRHAVPLVRGRTGRRRRRIRLVGRVRRSRDANPKTGPQRTRWGVIRFPGRSPDGNAVSLGSPGISATERIGLLG